MNKYRYKAYDVVGSANEGELSAATVMSARTKIKAMGLTLVRLEKSGAGSVRLLHFIQFNRKPKLAEIEILTSKMALLLSNGVKIDRALDIIKKGRSNKVLGKLVDDIYEEIRKGVHLSVAMEKYPDVFDPLYISVIRIGEATGHLGEAFSDMAANLSFRRSIRQKTLEALFYPGFIFVLCCLAVIFMFDFIVPKLSVVFAGMKDLPFYTRFMLSISSFVQQYQLILLGGVILLGFFINRIKKKQWFVRIYDAMMLKIPGVRNMYLTLENLRFVSSLAILLKNKVVISDALEYGVKVVGNSYVKNKLLNVKNEVRQGNKLSVVMAKTDLFSDAFDGLIEIGEQTGNLAGIFHEMEIRLKTDYENSVSAMIKIIEPVMIVVMGSIVGSVVIVMLLSIVSLNEIGF